MTPTFHAALALPATLAVGVVAHEFSHAAALRVFGVRCRVDWFPDGDRSGAAGSLLGARLAAVTPLPDDGSRPPGEGTRPPDGRRVAAALRVSAVAPFVLAAPLLAVVHPAVPDPFAVGHPAGGAAVVGWLACALPSPQDFSLLWHPRRALAGGSGDDPTE